MKLTDFKADPELNGLRDQMQAEFTPFKSAKATNPLTKEELEALVTKGIEIPLKEVGFLADGTFTFKGRRVVVYIRDITTYRTEYTLPKFHLAMCETLLTMREEGRYERRYVVSARDDNFFRIQKIQGNAVISADDEKLHVCQNCLHALQYKSFNKTRPHVQKRKFIEGFQLKEFFDEFGRSPVWKVPDFDSTHAPTNVYSADFFEIARSIKERRGYVCEAVPCRRDLSHPHNRRFLHAHHKSAEKSDNRPSNIELLCVRCHAFTFRHAHLKQTRDYKDYCQKFGLLP